jgi:hypothetical protein
MWPDVQIMEVTVLLWSLVLSNGRTLHSLLSPPTSTLKHGPLPSDGITSYTRTLTAIYQAAASFHFVHFAKTLEHLKHTMWLTPKTKNYTFDIGHDG